MSKYSIEDLVNDILYDIKFDLILYLLNNNRVIYVCWVLYLNLETFKLGDT